MKPSQQHARARAGVAVRAVAEDVAHAEKNSGPVAPRRGRSGQPPQLRRHLGVEVAQCEQRGVQPRAGAGGAAVWRQPRGPHGAPHALGADHGVGG